jgi:hypothetical protein
MRDFLDAILMFINAETLTDVEFGTVTISVQNYSIATYNQLKTILESREMVSDELKKLANYFRAKGTSISSSSASHTPRSNILIGKAL